MICRDRPKSMLIRFMQHTTMSHNVTMWWLPQLSCLLFVFGCMYLHFHDLKISNITCLEDSLLFLNILRSSATGRNSIDNSRELVSLNVHPYQSNMEYEGYTSFEVGLWASRNGQAKWVYKSIPKCTSYHPTWEHEGYTFILKWVSEQAGMVKQDGCTVYP